uniref:Uncharacterized protein n=1 Tax=Arundo donax TaxID=35708 RepID=A0A0A9HQ91_ARUDO
MCNLTLLKLPELLERSNKNLRLLGAQGKTAIGENQFGKRKTIIIHFYASLVPSTNFSSSL